MISQIESWILGWLQTLFDAWGWWGVAGMMAFENFTGITPSEIVLALAGWMLISDHELPATVIFLGGLYAALGSALGASMAYWTARLGGRPVVDRMAGWVRLNQRISPAPSANSNGRRRVGTGRSGLSPESARWSAYQPGWRA